MTEQTDAAEVARPAWGTEDYRRYAVLFNDITHAPVERLHFRDRQILADYLWAQGWRRDVRPEDVVESRVAADAAFDKALAETRAEYRDALDRLGDR